MSIHLTALLCVLGIAIGQILFKLGAMHWSTPTSLPEPKAMVYLILAFALYGITTIGWVLVLRKADLGRIYPIMALAFVIVPLASRVVFGETYPTTYIIGCTLIIIGIFFTTYT